MNKVTELRIQPILDHYEAYKAWEPYEEAFDNLAKLLNPDNSCYLFDTPWQAMIERRIKQHEPDLWDWYQWWLFEAAEGTHGGEYSIEDWDTKEVFTYDTKTQSLQEFLETLAQHYE